jgi:hypothetical protein
MPVGGLLPIRIWDAQKVTAFGGKKDVTGCKIANRTGFIKPVSLFYRMNNYE